MRPEGAPRRARPPGGPGGGEGGGEGGGQGAPGGRTGAPSRGRGPGKPGGGRTQGGAGNGNANSSGKPRSAPRGDDWQPKGAAAHESRLGFTKSSRGDR
jgi:23S rRNA pseudouridine2605 synthase